MGSSGNYRTKLSEIKIQNQDYSDGSKVLIIKDTEVRQLQVVVSKYTKRYRLYVCVKGKRVCISIGYAGQMRLVEARRKALEMLLALYSCNDSLGNTGGASVEDLLDGFYGVSQYGSGTKSPVLTINKHLKPLLEEHGVNSIDFAIAQNHVNGLIAKGLSPETIRKICLYDKKFYQYLIQLRHVDFNPFEGVNRPRVSNIRSEILPQNLRAYFIKCCLEEGGISADLILLLLYTGLRVSEATNIKCVDLSSDLSKLVLPKTKSGKRQYIALNSAAKAIVERRLSETWNDYLFPSPVFDDRHISAPRACFLNIKQRMLAKGHDISNLVMHDLRRTFATVCAEVTGGDFHMVAQQLRHSSTHVVQRYVHYQSADIALASEATAQALSNTMEVSS